MSKFVPISEYQPPKYFPANLTFIHSDGNFERVTFRGPEDRVSFKEMPVAVKVEQASIGERVMNAFAASPEGRSIYGPQIDGIAKFAQWAEKEGYLVPLDEEEDPDFISKKVREIRHATAKSLPTNLEQDVRNWFTNPEKYPEVPVDIGNRILTVKPLGNGCRVVCLPTGHTIAYTYARALFRILCGEEPYDYHVNQSSVKVREYYGNNQWSSVRWRNWSMKNGTLRLGCQRIPASAIRDLARREGWGGKIRNKYL